MYVLGIDAGFEHIGLALVAPDERGNPRVVQADSYRTKPVVGERVAQSDFERTQELAKYLYRWISPDVKAGVVELPHGGSKSQRAGRAMGLASAVVAAVAAVCGLPMETVSPYESKICITGHSRASKASVQRAVFRLMGWPETPYEGGNWSGWRIEHAADAAAAVWAAWNSHLIRAARTA